MHRDALHNFDNTFKLLLFISKYLCILPAILGPNSCPRNSLWRASKGNDRERDPSDTNSTSSTYGLFYLDETTSNTLPFISLLLRLLQFHLGVNLSLLPTTCHYLLCLMQGQNKGDTGKCGSSSTSRSMMGERGISW